MRKNQWFLAIMMIVFLFVIAACNSDDANVNIGEQDYFMMFEQLDRIGLDEETIVAVFDEGVVNGAEFAEFLAVHAFLNPYAEINSQEYRLEVMNDLIMEKIITRSFEENDWVREQTDIVLAEIITAYGEETVENAYSILQINEEEIKEALIAIFKMEGYFREKVTQLEMEKFYDEVTEELTSATFTHILIANEIINENDEIVERTEAAALDIATDIYTKLSTGEDFNELAIEYSDDLLSLDNGGRYYDMYINDLVPEFKEALLTQQLQEIGDIVQTDYGYHIIRVEELQLIPFEQVEQAIIGELVGEKFNEYYFDELPNYIVEIKL